MHVVNQEGSVQSELIFAAESLEQHVVDPISGANYSFGIEGVRDSDPGSEIPFVDLYQRALFERPIGSKYQTASAAVRRGIEISQLVLAFERGRAEVIAQAQIERQFAAKFPIVLNESRQHPQALIDEVDVCEL